MRRITKCLHIIIILGLIVVLSQCSLMKINNNYPEIEPIGTSYNHYAPLNPERGWYISRSTDDISINELDHFRNSNVTVLMLKANLKDYLTGPLDSQKLDEIDHVFSLAQKAGLSVIFRAAYDFDGKNTPEPPDPDMSMSIILGHIKQLSPIFYKYEDILFNVQAGFLGPWGEWHHSRYGDPIKPEYQQKIVNALLEAVPESVTIALRRPEFIRTAAGSSQPVTTAEAFGTSKMARLAFHDDALMSDDTDMGTFVAKDYPRNTELAWVNKQTRYTPMAGETNEVSRYNDSENAITLADLMNLQSLNIEYHPNVLKKWRSASHEGMSAFDFIGMKMGYRFVVDSTEINTSDLYGGSLRINLKITNTGFGNLLKEKKFEIVLIKDKSTYRATINEDARFWNKNDQISREYYFRLPAGIASGDWDVYLGLSSTFDSLAANPAYSVQFANEGMWDPKLGLNKIGTVQLSSAATDAKNSGSKEFIQFTPQ